MFLWQLFFKAVPPSRPPDVPPEQRDWSFLDAEDDDIVNTVSQDVIYNIMFGFLILFFIAFLLIRPFDPSKGIEPKAEIVAVLSWPDGSADDLDIWLKFPNGKNVSWRAKNVEHAFLDRDDIGNVNETFVDPDGKTKRITVNQEIITLRAIVPGRYTANVQVYRDNQAVNPNGDKLPYPVQVTLIKINPTVRNIVRREIIMEKQGQQKTAFSFTLTPDGNVIELNTEEEIPFIPMTPPGYSEYGYGPN